MDNSLIQTLQILLDLKGKSIAGYELANMLDPIIQVNTLEKNICYLRKEYGDTFIPSEPVEGKSYVHYWCEPGLATLNNNFEKIGKDTRERLNSLLNEQGRPLKRSRVSEVEERAKSAKKAPKNDSQLILAGLIQVNIACLNCGSYYQRNGVCNIC